MWPFRKKLHNKPEPTHQPIPGSEPTRNSQNGTAATEPSHTAELTPITPNRSEAPALGVLSKDASVGLSEPMPDATGIYSASPQTETPTDELITDQEPVAAITVSPATELPIEPRPSPPVTNRIRGRVKFFDDDKGIGFIAVTSPDQGIKKEDVWFHISAVDGNARLFQDEIVEFEILTKPDGRSAAVKITRVELRVRGKVKLWLDNKGYGFLKAESVQDDIFVHYTEIQAEGPRYLEIDEDVEFTIHNAEKPKAVRVQVFQSRFAFERFANNDQLRDGPLLDQLAAMAQKEDWNYKRNRPDRTHPVLFGYIMYTFDRLIEEKKIATSVNAEGLNIACGNTGLVTDKQEEIFAYFTELKRSTLPQKWVLRDFVKYSDRRLVAIGRQPEIANYFTDPVDLLYNPSRELRVDVEHVLEDNLNRFPEALRSNPYHLRNAFKGACDNSIKRVRRNYKTAIPQFHQGKIQLLLPMCLSDPSVAELALVVSREGEVYIGTTVLPLDMAYNNARLIARPDREWLQP